MAIEYRKARTEERADLVDFGNYVFSQAHQPHDFKTLLPKVYADCVDPADVSTSHYIAVEGGKIRAMVGCPTSRIRYLDETVRLGLVGTVSVHPYARREGHMRRLMADMIADASGRGIDVLALGGQHQRYQHYGFEQAGTSVLFRFGEGSIRHSFGAIERPDVTFRPLEEGDPALGDCFCLYEAQPVAGGRPRDQFLAISRSWTSTLFAVEREGVYLGYLISSGERISELVLSDEADADVTLRSWFRRKPDPFTIQVPVWMGSRIARWIRDCSNYVLESQEMIRVVNWLPLLKGSLKLRCFCGPVQDGDTVLELDGKRFHLSVKDGAGSVEETGEPPIRSLAGPEAVRCLFTHGLAACPALRWLDCDWLPLPFELPEVERF